jgi:biotin carboxyl carrier protein
MKRKKTKQKPMKTVEAEAVMEEVKEESPKLYAFTYEGVAYKTLLTKKYKERTPYEPPDLRKVHAFIPGTIVSVEVKPKDKVEKGDTLVVLKAMKMNNRLVSVIDGVVKKIHVKPGDVVVKNQLLVELK